MIFFWKFERLDLQLDAGFIQKDPTLTPDFCKIHKISRLEKIKSRVPLHLCAIHDF